MNFKNRLIFTYAQGLCFRSGLYVCVSVYMCAKYLKKLRTEFDDNFDHQSPHHDPDRDEFLKNSLFTLAIPIGSQE